MATIRLGVNIDHVATLREVRKAQIPSLLFAADCVARAGAQQITVHLREDRRHIQDRDLQDLMKWGKLPINLEMALTNEMVAIAAKAKPACVTLVPERRQEMTTESGLDLKRWCGRNLKKTEKLLSRLKAATEISAFIGADLKQVRAAADLGFQAVEFHTGTYAEAFEKDPESAKCLREVERLKKAALLCREYGLEVRAGHGLNEENIEAMKSIPYLAEVNIGHSIVCQSIFVGLENSIERMLKLL